MRACWTQEPVEWPGAFYRMGPVSAMPKPRQKGGIPIWVGGHTDAALRRAGELSDGWHPIGLRPPAMLLPEEFRDKVAIVRDWARKAGREPRRHAVVPMPPGSAAEAGQASRRRAPALPGHRLEVIGDVKTYQALGVTHFVFDPIGADVKGWLAIMERFADEVRPRVQRTAGPRAVGP